MAAQFKYSVNFSALSLAFSLICTAANHVAAQNEVTSVQPQYASVVATRTDALFANKTTIYTKKGVSDAKILEEIKNDYSLGDEVRITTETPPTFVVEKEEVPIVKSVVIESKAPMRATPSVYTMKDVLSKPSEMVLTRGSIIRTEHLQFAKDAATLDAASYPYLDAVYQYLADHPLIIVEVGGHTNMLPSHEYSLQLSVARAKAIVSYLTAKGIAGNRLTTRGYGKTQPIVAANTEAAHQLNQRVELKILKSN